MRALNPGWAGRADLILFSESRDKKKIFFSGGMKELLTRVCATHPASPLDLPPVALRYGSKKQGGEGSPFKCN